MKVLIYGLQSSGASLFAFFMAQRPRSIGIVDLNNHRLAPRLEIDLDIILKTVITTRWSLEEHIQSFMPDTTILFIRNPYTNYHSLMGKIYANRSGNIDDKFRLLDRIFQSRARFDAVFSYEDFIHSRQDTLSRMVSLGWSVPADSYDFPRPAREIYLFNCHYSNWCRNNPAAPGPRGGWGMGNITGKNIKLSLANRPYIPELDARVRKLCPNIHEYYKTRQ